jgi:hypothetical protein
VPWGKDDLRDKAEGRDAVFAVLKVTNRNHKPFITLSGDKNLKTIVIVDDLSKAKELGLSSLDCQIYNYGFHLKMFVGN